MGGATRSAVIVTIPEAEGAVAAHRSRLDQAAQWGVPAHVTVLVPFVPPSEIDASVLERLADAVASVPRSTAIFDATRWFGTDVLWVAPRPSTVFEALTAAVSAAFPDHPPYGGAFDEVVPHLTVGHNAPYAVLCAAEAAVRPLLPFDAEIATAALWCGSDSPGGWSQVRELALG